MVGMQHFNLRWNNHTSNILQVFADHLSSELLVDVTLSCQRRFIKAHKIILSACSPYFQEVFATQTQDKHPVIIMKDIKYEDLHAIIKFMYNGEIRVQETQLENLLQAAELLQVKGLDNVRNKYERGEITSMNRGPRVLNKKTPKPASEATNESTPSVIGATVASTAPTLVPLNRGSSKNLSSDTRTLATSSPTMITGTMTRIPASTLRAAKIAARTTPSVGSTVTFATLVPKSAIMTVSQANSLLRNTSNGANEIALTTTTSNDLENSTVAAIGVPRIPATYTTPALSTPIITCVTGNFIDPNDPKPGDKNSFLVPTANFASDAPLFRAIYTIPIAKADEKPATNRETTETKSPALSQQQPTVRKRRKTTHVVNKLAQEKVIFTTNGTVLRGPENKASNNQTKKNKSSTSAAIQQHTENTAKIEEITVKKMRVTTETKVSKESWLNEEVEEVARKIPRPLNAFMIFAADWRKKLALKNPDEDNKQISVMLGIKWKSLSINEKEGYYSLAKQADEEHKEKYPGYYYSPQQARIRKMLRRDLARSKSLSSSPNHELQLMKACEHEEREIVQFSDSSEYEDDDDPFDSYKEEDDFDNDVILEELIEEEEEDNPVEKLLKSAKRKDGGGNASSSNRGGNFAKT